jgi:hypothetical protein
MMTWKDLLAPEGSLARIFARGIWLFAGAMTNKHSEDPVYKKNLQRLIERNRKFEETKE